MTTSFACLFLVALGAAPGDRPADDRPGRAVAVEGRAFPARLLAIGDDGKITLRDDAGQREIMAPDLVRWGTRADGKKGSQVLLVGGGEIAADVVKIDEEHVLIASDLWGEISLPLGLLRGIVFWPPADRLQRDRLLDRVALFQGDHDQLQLENGDLVSGTLGHLEDGIVHFSTKAGTVEIPVEKVTALVFNPALVDKPRTTGPYTQIGFRDGTNLAATSIESRQRRVHLTLPGKLKLVTDPDVSGIDEIAWLRPVSSGVTYLSDLKPAGYKHVPFLDLPWSYGVDRNVLGGRLRAGERCYDKGLGMHSTSRLAYELRRPYRRFQTDLAIDDSAGPRGSVTFRVFLCDAAGTWGEAFKSPVVRGSDPPLPVSVDLAGAKRIALVVDFADRADELDYANWLGARLVE